MHTFLVFDLDDTLAQIGKPVLPENVVLLQALEAEGRQIVLSSGKPVYYLCGLARQLGFSNAILIGETGSVIQGSVSLPPRFHQTTNVTPEALRQMHGLQEVLAPYRDRLWYQPNEVALTPFPKDPEMFAILRKITAEMTPKLTALDVYPQVDCIDFIPKGTNKGTGLRHLAQILQATQKDFLVVGDGANDLPMFRFAHQSICIAHAGCQVSHLATYAFPTLNQALRYIQTENL